MQYTLIWSTLPWLKRSFIWYHRYYRLAQRPPGKVLADVTARHEDGGAVDAAARSPRWAYDGVGEADERIADAGAVGSHLEGSEVAGIQIRHECCPLET